MDQFQQFQEELKTHQLNDSMEFGKAKARDEAMGEDITEIKEDIKGIKENHLAHIQASMGAMEINIVKLSSTSTWNTRILMGICGGIGLLAIAYITK